MAYNPNDPNKQDDEEQRPIQQSSGQVATISGTGSALPESQSIPAHSATSKVKSSGSGWTNLRTYVERNKPQAAELGGKVGGLITNEANKASNLINAQSEAAKNDISPEAYQVDKNWLVQGLRSNPQDAKFQKQYADWTQTQAKPFEWSNEGSNAVYAANQKADLTNSEGGRKELLNELQKPQATAGVSNLNNLFLQSSDEGKDAIGSAVKSFQDMNLEDKLSQAQQAAMARQAQAEQAAAGSRGQVRDTTTQEIAGMNDALKVRLGTDLNNARNEQNRIVDNLRKGKSLSNSDLAILGISPKEYQQYQNVQKNYQNAIAERNRITAENAANAPVMKALPDLPNLMNYLKLKDLSDKRFSTASVMTKEDEAKARALQSLAQISNAQMGGLPLQGSNLLTNDNIDDFNLAAFLQEAKKRGY